MPALIFLVAARALLVRLRLEREGMRINASIVSIRPWYDDTSHLDVTYRYVADGVEYQGSADLGGSRVGVGDWIEVLYRPRQPASSQPVRGTVPGSIGLNVVVMVAMVALELWMLSLWQSAGH
jgi:hypothetical protein